ncbi:MAG: methyltransferase domain-containing protein [Ignavibacteriae bacterium]|nr:methyltransferase domain-containing protein [Ignavibacteriota bacterium]
MIRNEYEPIRREYLRLASRYDTRWKFYSKASIRETLRRLDVGCSDYVLDVGCGTGVLLKEVSLAVPEARLAGVDLSPEMLEVARHKLGAEVDLRQGRAEALPFDDEAFDLVVSTNVFHFIRNPVGAVVEMFRVLRPSGRVVITDWCDDYLACRVCDLFLRVLRRAHFRTYGSGECRNLLVEANFVNVHVERYRISWLWGLMTATAGKDVAQQGNAADRASCGN